jgi:hypothetical protein
MTNYPFVTITHRGLVNGARCLICGTAYESTDPALKEQHWEDACNRARELCIQQDTIDGAYLPRGLSLKDRQAKYRESQQ